MTRRDVEFKIDGVKFFKKNNNNSVVQSLKRELQFISVIEFEKVVVKSGRVSSCCKEKWIRLRRHEHQRRVMTHGSIRERQGRLSIVSDRIG